MRGIFAAGLCALSIFAAGGAQAQTNGRWSWVVGERTCAGQPEHVRGGLNWRFSCEAACPAGTALVTGACRTAATDNQGLALEGFGPQGNGWSCDYVAVRHDIDRMKGASPRNRVRAEAHCRDLSQFPSARWVTPAEGALMVLARSGADIGEKMRFSIRVCNTEGPGTVTVHLLTRDPEKPGIPERPAGTPVPLGSCLMVDAPVAVFVQNGATQESGLAGTYQLYREGTFKPAPVVVPLDKLVANTRDERAFDRRIVQASAPEAVKAKCEKLANGPKGVWGRCAVDAIKETGNYRVCFGSRYAAPVNEEPNFPGDLLPAILNPKLADEPVPAEYFTDRPGGRDTLNPVYANACRDYLNIRDLNFLILKRDGVPADDVTEVWFTLQKLG